MSFQIIIQQCPISGTPPPLCYHLFVVGGLRTSMTRIALLAGVFILLLGPLKADRLKDRGQQNSSTAVVSLYFPIFLPLCFPIILQLLLLFLCFSRPYITFLRCSDVKPLSLTHSLISGTYISLDCTLNSNVAVCQFILQLAPELSDNYSRIQHSNIRHCRNTAMCICSKWATF